MTTSTIEIEQEGITEAKGNHMYLIILYYLMYDYIIYIHKIECIVYPTAWALLR